jgi:hypothetical protein
VSARNGIFLPYTKDGVAHPANTEVELRVPAIKSKQGSRMQSSDLRTELFDVLGLAQQFESGATAGERNNHLFLPHRL